MNHQVVSVPLARRDKTAQLLGADDWARLAFPAALEYLPGLERPLGQCDHSPPAALVDAKIRPA